MFATILARLEEQDKTAFAHRKEIKESISTFQTDLRGQDDRIRVLEKSAWRQRGAVGIIALAIPLAWEYLTKKI